MIEIPKYAVVLNYIKSLIYVLKLDKNEFQKIIWISAGFIRIFVKEKIGENY